MSQKILQFSPRRRLGMRATTLISIPSPTLHEIWFELAIQQLHDIFSDNGKELPAMKRTSCRDVQVLAVRVCGDDEVLVGREAIPTNSIRIERGVFKLLAKDAVEHPPAFLFELVGNRMLRLVCFLWWCGYPMPRSHYCVLEACINTGFQDAVWRRREDLSHGIFESAFYSR